MHRQTKSPLKVKENGNSCPEEKEEASKKMFKVPKSRVIRASEKENSSDGNQTQPRKRALKYPKGLEEELFIPKHPKGDPGSSLGALRGDVGTELALAGNSKETFPSSRAGPLGGDSYLTPERDKREGQTAFGISEEQRKKPVDFAAVTIAEFGIAQENVTTGWKGNSPASLKFRRRSTIGLRGSPENNTLIRYLAQQRSNRQREPFTQINPFKNADVRSLKDRIEAFQTSFESLQEAEGETGLSQVDGASQEGSTQQGHSSQNKTPFKKEQKLEQWSEKFMLDKRGADLKDNLNVPKCEPRICSFSSPHPGTEPAPKEWVYGQQNPAEPLGTVGTGEMLGTAHVFRPDPIPADPGRRKGGFGEELSLGMLDEGGAFVTPPVTPRRTANTPSNDLSQSGSLRSILKKTPRKQLLEGPEELSHAAVARRGDESVPDFNCAKIFEASETESTESLNIKTPKKKKVTFGEVLSPEIFDQTLPPNTPLHRGASPALHTSSPAQPLPQLHFPWDQECLEPLQDSLEASVATGDLPPVGKAEVTETEKPDVMKTHSATKRKAQEPAAGFSGNMDTQDAEDTNPRDNKIPKLTNGTSSAPKRTKKSRHTGCGKRRKKKVRKSLYGEREMASKKPLLSPIPEIPEVFSFVSSPNSPEADALLSEDAVAADPKSRNACQDVQEKPVVKGKRGKKMCAAELDVAAPGNRSHGTFQESQGDPGAAPGSDQKQGKEAAGEKEEQSGSLRENEKLQGKLLTGLEFLEQATAAPEGAQRAQCPLKDSVSASPARTRRRSSSAIFFPPVENLGMTGIDLPVSPYNVEDVLCVPKGSFQPQRRRRRSDPSGEMRVRRSMRLSKEAGSEGLAWIELPTDIPKPPLAAPAPKSRRTVSTSLLTGARNVHREANVLPLAAPGKEEEKEDSAHPSAPGRRGRRRSLSAATPGETRGRRTTHSVNRKDRKKQKHSKEAEIPVEGTLGEASVVSGFLK